MSSNNNNSNNNKGNNNNNKGNNNKAKEVQPLDAALVLKQTKMSLEDKAYKAAVTATTAAANLETFKKSLARIEDKQKKKDKAVVPYLYIFGVGVIGIGVSMGHKFPNHIGETGLLWGVGIGTLCIGLAVAISR